MQIFYTDISKVFQCNISVTGAPIIDATARLVVSVSGKEFIFNGSIDAFGVCTFNIPPLGTYNVIGSGTINVEVIIDGAIFNGFSDTILVEQSGGSDYNSFTTTTNYDSVNNIDYNNTWLIKKIYNEQPYIILPSDSFSIKVGATLPSLKLFVMKLGEQFGDPIPLPNLNNYTIVLKVYDYNHSLVCFGNVTTFDQTNGQLTYNFSPLDFFTSGVYFMEVELTFSGSTLVLPCDSKKLQIIVRD